MAPKREDAKDTLNQRLKDEAQDVAERLQKEKEQLHQELIREIWKNAHPDLACFGFRDICFGDSHFDGKTFVMASEIPKMDLFRLKSGTISFHAA